MSTINWLDLWQKSSPLVCAMIGTLVGYLIYRWLIEKNEKRIRRFIFDAVNK